MNKPIKAALLSALVFPGAGHIFLKKKFRGIAFAGISFVCLYVLVAEIFKGAMQIAEKIQRGEIAPNAAEITELAIHQASAQPSSNVSVLLIVCWLASILDAYRLGWR